MSNKNLLTKAVNNYSFEKFREYITSILHALDKKNGGFYLTNDEYIRYQEELTRVRKNNHAEELLSLSKACGKINFSAEIKSSYQYALILHILQINTKRPDDFEIEEPKVAFFNLWGDEYNSKLTKELPV